MTKLRSAVDIVLIAADTACALSIRRAWLSAIAYIRPQRIQIKALVFM